MNNFLNLPYHLIKDIVSPLGIVDLICFSLSCKQLYINREKYLWFDHSIFHVGNINSYHTFCFPSYHSLYKRSIESLLEYSLCTMKVMTVDEGEDGYKTIENNLRYYDFVEPYDTFNFKDNENLKKVNFLILEDDKPTTEIPDLSSCLSVEKLSLFVINSESASFNVDLKRIPPNIRNMTLNHLGGVLNFQGVFTEGITVMYIGCQAEPIKPGVLPKSLAELYLMRYDHQFQENTLPSNLKVLGLDTYSRRLEHLPVSLQSLTLGMSLRLSEDEVAPLFRALPNLLTIDGIEYQKLRFIPQTSKVESIKPLPGSCMNKPLDFSMLPTSVNHLDLSVLNDYQLKRYGFPPTLTELSLFRYTGKLEPGMLPYNLKCLKFNMLKFDYTPDLFPETIEKLVLGYDYDYPLSKSQFREMISNLNRNGGLELYIGREFFSKYTFKDDLPLNVTSIVIDSVFTLRRADSDTFILVESNVSGGFIKSQQIDDYMKSQSYY